MKILKFPQSCIVLEKLSGRVVVDPGNLALEAHSLDELGDVQAVLYTHRHADHFDERYVAAFIERGATIYGNTDIVEAVGSEAVEVRDGETYDVAGFEVTARELRHFPMVDGSAGPLNTGFIFDRQLFHPGDGIHLSGLKVGALAAPIAGPSISFRDAYQFVKETEAQYVVPIHYDFFVADPHLFGEFCDIAEVIVVGNGESTELRDFDDS